MKSLFERMNVALSKRMRYQRTVAELSALSIDTALDLNIYHGDIQKIASQSVYGR